MNTYDLTPEALKQALIETGLVTEESLAEILGEKFNSGRVPEIEFLMVQAGKISEVRLRNIAASLAALPPAPVKSTALSILPRDVALATGSIALAGDRRMVAFVEPTTRNKQRVSEALGGADYEACVTTPVHWRMLFDAAYVDTENNFPPISGIEDVLIEAVRRRASDFHIVVGEPPSLRVDGDLHRMECANITPEQADVWFSELAGAERWGKFLTEWDADQAISYDKYRIRLNYGRDRHGPTLAGRLIPVSIPTPSQLGMPASLTRLAELERGLVLVTGPTGSGKSTTLASLLNDMAATRPVHIITLEDPIEYFLTGERAVVSQREKGSDFVDFAPALRQALRQDPDVILVGELRDRSTMEAALTAAETGHLVFGTLHTYDAVSTINRYVNAFPADEHEQVRNQLAYLVEGIISQTLVPRRDGGRVAAMEIMLKSPATSQNMRKTEGLTQLRSTLEVSTKEGMQTMELALARLVKAGIISRDAAVYKARRKSELLSLLGG